MIMTRARRFEGGRGSGNFEVLSYHSFALVLLCERGPRAGASLDSGTCPRAWRRRRQGVGGEKPTDLVVK